LVVVSVGVNNFANVDTLVLNRLVL